METQQQGEQALEQHQNLQDAITEGLDSGPARAFNFQEFRQRMISRLTDSSQQLNPR